MDRRVVETIRRGQAEMQDRVLTGLLIEKGVLSPSESAELTSDSPPGSLADRLIEDGRISRDEVEQLSEEMDLLESLDTAVEDATPTRVREAAREPSSRVGKYVLVEKIGAGGMGEVWRAWDYGLGRWVALKFLKVRDDKLIRRFMREATLLARLSHPNITQVYEIGIHDRRPFLCMELVEGGSPGEEALSRRQAAQVMLEAARGVEYAHGRDIIHRDLKPSNLLISDEGRIFVTDFGLARLQSEGGSITASGAVLGTPSYMAPEQAQRQDADARTDVYGLGATLYGLVEGRPPFTGESAVEIVHRVASAPTPELEGARDDLTVVVRKAMERDRRDRYQTTGELVEDLELYLDDEPVLAQPITTVERIWRKARRRPLYSGSLTAVILLALVFGVWGAGWLGEQRRRSQADAVLEEIDPLIDEYRRYAQAGTWDSAEARAAIEAMRPAVDEALEIAPEHSRSRLYQARYLRWTEDFEAALAVLDPLLVEHPDYWDAYVERGKIRLFVAGSAGWGPDPQVISSMQGLEFVYEPPPAEATLAIDLARADYEALPEDHDERPRGLAVISYFEGDYVAAADRLGSLVAQEGFRNEERRMLLWSLLPLGRFAEAEALAEQLRTGGIFAADALETRVLSLAAQADFGEAARTATVYLELYPTATHLENLRPFWLFLDGQMEEALAEYDRLLAKEPDAVNLLLARAQVHNQLGDLEGALADADRAVALEPDNPDAHYQRAMALWGTPGSIEALTTAVELSSDSGLYLGQRALAHTLEESWEEGKADALEAVRLEPDNPVWHWVLAMSLAELGEHGAAGPHFQKAIDGGYGDGYTYFARAWSRLEAGDCAGALSDLGAADEAEPGYVEAETREYFRGHCPEVESAASGAGE